MNLFWENLYYTIKETIKSIGCKHNDIDMGISNRCSKCGRIKYKQRSDNNAND